MKNYKKIFIYVFATVFVLVATIIFAYLKGIPALISNQHFINFVENRVKKNLAVELNIEKPVLKTSVKSNIGFSVQDLSLTKDNNKLLAVKNFETEISFRKLIKKNIVVKKLGADYIFADIEKIIELFPQKEEKSEKKSDWKFDMFRSLLYIKDCEILYNTKNNFKLRVLGKNMIISETRNPKPFKFNIFVELEKNNKKLKFKISDNNTVFTNENKMFAKNTEFYINNSKVIVNYVGRRDRTFEINLHSKKFDFADVEDSIKSNAFVENGSGLLSSLIDMQGTFDFDLNISNNDMNGKFIINKLSFSLPDAKNLPIVLNSGKIFLSKNKIAIEGVKGYHGKSVLNTIDIDGSITDYMKTCDTFIVSYVVLTKEFTNDYLSPMIGYPIELVGKTKAKVKFNMLNGKMDISLIFRLIEGYDLLLDGLSFTPTTYQRAFKADVSLDKDNIELKNLNYYIAKSFTAGVEAEPLLRVFGNFNANNGEIKNLGFEIPKPLRSEFMNAIFKQRIFKEGYMNGNFEYIASGTAPYLKGYFSLDNVKIPSQRMFIKKGELSSKNNILNLTMDGRYKRSEFNLDSNVLNEIKAPFIFKSINLNIANLDIERVMKTVNNIPENQTETVSQRLEDNEANQAKADEEVFFDTNLFVIENCLLNIKDGIYKQIKFGNVLANMTLDRNGIFELNSNKFDIADGTSSAKIHADLKNQLYKLHLGLKDVNSDAIATSLLSLPKEISGKARGLIDIETDKSLMLNGTIKFNIKNGNIAKVGLIEYALNFVSLFRNPLAMISPTTLIDLVNIPEGEFDKIEGTLQLKDNIINRMMIKSYAPQLSSFIVGRYDLVHSDATLRIYTKFSNKHKGLAGVLRNISLNSFANYVPLNINNDINYYTLELSQIPDIDVPEKDCQVFLTKIDGDVEHNNFLSTLKRIK